MIHMSDIKELIFDNYIAPMKDKKGTYVGVEIELPIVNLKGEATDHDTARKAFNKAVEKLGLTGTKFDAKGNCHEAKDEKTGDLFSFDCSYNNLELSFGKEQSLVTVNDRFKEYIKLFNTELRKDDHIITGFGVQPYYNKCRQDYIESGRYKMLEGYLRKDREWKSYEGFHNFPGFGTFASSTQVQIDVRQDELIDTLNTFSLLEPLKSIIFANSMLSDDLPHLLCSRDMLWEYSTHGINRHNIGSYETVPQTIDEVVDYISSLSAFCCERDDKYIFFYPVPFAEYVKKGMLQGEYYHDGSYHQTSFEPLVKDIDHLRSYKFLDITKRGTIEYRSLCAQPLDQAFAGIAFQTGLVAKLPKLDEILRNDKVIYGHGYSAHELRDLFNRDSLPGFVDPEALRKLLMKITALSYDGLLSRGFGEEKLLLPMCEREDILVSPSRRRINMLRQGHDLTDVIHAYAAV